MAGCAGMASPMTQILPPIAHNGHSLFSPFEINSSVSGHYAVAFKNEVNFIAMHLLRHSACHRYMYVFGQCNVYF